MNEKLSEHFSYGEVFVAGKCGDVNDADVEKARWLCEHVLEPARTRIGVPIHINSGKRSSEYNRKIGGAIRSEHLFLVDQAAADIDTKSGEWNEHLFRAILEQSRDKIGQLIAYIDLSGTCEWVHVSKVAARWAHSPWENRFLLSTVEKVGGKVKTAPFLGEFKRP